MSKRTALLGFVCFFLCVSHAWAWDDSTVRQTYVSDFDSQDLGVVHGYSPKPFSPDSQPNYWITPEEAGHYILGRSRSSYDPTTLVSTPAPRAGIMADPTRVLVAPARVLPIPEPNPQTPVLTDRPTRFNDSSDLSEVIKQHAWVIPFNL
ncbi:MAG: hypothetical protein JNN05_09445 [Candidatus Omnitrophica bacterium]|nr:hypothetical protein [Candidatus Omnitrophota bacterium]